MNSLACTSHSPLNKWRYLGLTYSQLSETLRFSTKFPFMLSLTFFAIHLCNLPVSLSSFQLPPVGWSWCPAALCSRTIDKTEASLLNLMFRSSGKVWTSCWPVWPLYIEWQTVQRVHQITLLKMSVKELMAVVYSSMVNAGVSSIVGEIKWVHEQGEGPA